MVDILEIIMEVIMKLKELLHIIFQPVPYDQDERRAYVRYAMQNKKPCDDKPAWKSYTPSRREWMRRSLHPWWVEFLAPWIVLGPTLLFVILVLLFVW